MQLEKSEEKKEVKRVSRQDSAATNKARAGFMAFSQLLSMPIGGAQHGRRRLMMMEVE